MTEILQVDQVKIKMGSFKLPKLLVIFNICLLIFPFASNAIPPKMIKNISECFNKNEYSRIDVYTLFGKKLQILIRYELIFVIIV